MLGDEPPDEDSLHSTFATFDPGCMVSELRSLSILTCVGRPRGGCGGCRTSRRAPPQFWQAEARRRRDGDECRKRLRKWPAGPARLNARPALCGRSARPPGRTAGPAGDRRPPRRSIDRAGSIDRIQDRSVGRARREEKPLRSQGSGFLSACVTLCVFFFTVRACTHTRGAGGCRARCALAPRCGAWACVAYGPRRCCAVARRSPRVACSPTTCSIAPPASRQPCPCHRSLPRVPRSPSVRTGQA